MRRFLKSSAIGAAVLAMLGALTAAPVPAAIPSAAAALTPEQQLAKLTLPQRVGQLFMVAAGATGADINTMSDLKNFHVGSAYLAGRSSAGVSATAAVVNKMKGAVSAASDGNVPLAIATDQEGGYVQVLSGPGFSTIPTALVQGGKTPAVLQADAKVWGSQLKSAGLNMNLAPVLDTVPSAQFAPSNAPIGYYQREYGYTPQWVSDHGGAFAAGMRQAGIAPAIKHFPGLGRVTLNTDTSANVHDRDHTDDSYLLPYRNAIAAGARYVTISSAIYDRIDSSHVRAFSQIIMRTMLRGDLKFTGTIVSDDLCNAAQVAGWSLGVRAANFINAGGTMVLCANQRNIPSMYYYVRSRTDQAVLPG